MLLFRDRFEQLNVQTALVYDFPAQALIYRLILRDVHQPLRRLVHVAFTQLEQLLELAVDLLAIADAVQHICLVQVLRLDALDGQFLNLLLQRLVPLLQLTLLHLVVAQFLPYQREVIVQHQLLVLYSFVLLHLLRELIQPRLLVPDLGVPFLQLFLKTGDHIIFGLDDGLLQLKLPLQLLYLLLLGSHLFLLAVLCELDAAIRLALTRLLS